MSHLVLTKQNTWLIVKLTELETIAYMGLKRVEKKAFFILSRCREYHHILKVCMSSIILVKLSMNLKGRVCKFILLSIFFIKSLCSEVCVDEGKKVNIYQK